MKKFLNSLYQSLLRFIRKPKEKAFYSKFIVKDDLCFDVGANIGERTSTFISLGARVIAIEPQTYCASILKETFRDNEKVKIEQIALGDKEQTSEIYICDDSPTISTMSKEWKNKGRFAKCNKWENVEKIRTTTLDNLINKYGKPKFCKIDVEGYEKNVISGLSQPIKYISFEFTKEFLGNTKECLKHLNKIDPKVKYNYSVGESMVLNLNKWVSSKELEQLLEDSSQNDLWGDIYVSFTNSNI